jgi:hypothetical protein
VHLSHLSRYAILQRENALQNQSRRAFGSVRAEAARIDRDGKAFEKILSSAGFKKYFGEMEGEKLKTRPNDYPEDHPYIELLRYKSFLAVHRVSDKDAISENFAEHCARVFKALKPFDDFLNKSLE